MERHLQLKNNDDLATRDGSGSPRGNPGTPDAANAVDSKSAAILDPRVEHGAVSRAMAEDLTTLLDDDQFWKQMDQYFGRWSTTQFYRPIELLGFDRQLRETRRSLFEQEGEIRATALAPRHSGDQWCAVSKTEDVRLMDDSHTAECDESRTLNGPASFSNLLGNKKTTDTGRKAPTSAKAEHRE